MKKIISLLLCFVIVLSFSVIAFADEESEKRTEASAFYIDSENGNDDNEGTSPESPWKSADKLNSSEFIPGDKILFKCGQTFNGTFIMSSSGTESEPITYSSYGEGELPRIIGGEAFTMVIISKSNIIIENLDISGPTASGITIIAFQNENSDNITVRNCKLHDFYTGNTDSYACGIYVDCDTSGAKINNLTVRDCEIYNVAWGIHTKGVNAETNKKGFISASESYNNDFLFENLNIHDCPCAGIVLGVVNNAVVRCCRVKDCATLNDGNAYAPLWTRHVDGALIEYCDISGSTNRRDGMAIDFDGWSVNSTYRYIYSHDNNRFIRNCVYDSKTKNAGNKVYNCISVNDNNRINHSASTLISGSNPSFSRMFDFEFRDNILINPSLILWGGTPKALCENNIFCASPFKVFIQKILNFFTGIKQLDYTVLSDEEINAKIEEITNKIPV